MTTLPSTLSSSPTLWPLFVVTVVMQVLALCLSLTFNRTLADTYAVAERTAFTGRFYSVVNGAAGVIQFVGLPLLARRMPLQVLVLGPPVVVGLATLALPLYLHMEGVALVFLCFKVCEYAVFSAAKEMVYAPLPFEARYVSKNVIDVFAYRLGKGGMSLVLAVAFVGSAPPSLAFVGVVGVAGLGCSRGTQGHEGGSQ